MWYQWTLLRNWDQNWTSLMIILWIHLLMDQRDMLLLLSSKHNLTCQVRFSLRRMSWCSIKTPTFKLFAVAIALPLKNSPKKYKLTRTSKSALQDTMKHLPKETKVSHKEADCIVLNGVESSRPWFRMIIIFGGDERGSGIKGVRAKTLIILIKSHNAAS